MFVVSRRCLFALTYGDQYPLHIVPEEGHRYEHEGSQESASSERDAHQAIVLRAKRLRAQHVDSRAHSVEDAPDAAQTRDGDADEGRKNKSDQATNTHT